MKSEGPVRAGSASTGILDGRIRGMLRWLR